MCAFNDLIFVLGQLKILFFTILSFFLNELFFLSGGMLPQIQLHRFTFLFFILETAKRTMAHIPNEINCSSLLDFTYKICATSLFHGGTKYMATRTSVKLSICSNLYLILQISQINSIQALKKLKTFTKPKIRRLQRAHSGTKTDSSWPKTKKLYW